MLSLRRRGPIIDEISNNRRVYWFTFGVPILKRLRRPYFGLICLFYVAVIEILDPHKAEYNIMNLRYSVFRCLFTGTLRIHNKKYYAISKHFMSFEQFVQA